MQYLVLITIAAVIAILGLALFGWYHHLQDDEDDLV